MKILAFAASNSARSINAQLLRHALMLVEGAEVEWLEIRDYEMPLYSPDREEEGGVPEPAQRFYQKIGEADALMISFAEHNGSYTAAFKNLYDWMSRIDMKVYQGKPVVMLATSPAGRGGAGVLATATSTAPHFGADVRGSLSVPRFQKSFDAEAGRLVDDDLEAQLREVVSKLVDGGGA